jgi:hypothetical protein
MQIRRIQYEDFVEPRTCRSASVSLRKQARSDARTPPLVLELWVMNIITKPGAYAHETVEFVHCIELYAMQSACGVGAECPSLSVPRRTNRSWSHHGVCGMLIAGASSGHSLISVKYRVLVRVCWLIRSHKISRSKIRICLCSCLCSALSPGGRHV